MKLRDTGQIQKRAKKGGIPWLWIIVIAAIAYGGYWIYHNPPKLSGMNVSMPDISIPYMSATDKTLIVLFIPGLDNDLLTNWIDELPQIQQLINQGSWQEIQFHSSADLEAEWSSFATGKPVSSFLDQMQSLKNTFFKTNTPAEHTLFPESLSTLPVNTDQCFWNWLEAKRIPSLILDQKVKADINPTLLSFTEETVVRKNEILNALQEANEHCIVAVWHSVLRMNQRLYPGFDVEHPLHDIERSKADVQKIKTIYIELNALIKEIQTAAEREELQFLLVSTHGIPQARYQVNLNTWLWKNGYLTFNGDSQPSAIATNTLQSYRNAVNWSQTKAYSLGKGNIFINLDGREPNGSVNRFQYEMLAREIQQSLQDWTDHRWINMGEPVVQFVYRSQADNPIEPNQEPDLKMRLHPSYTFSFISTHGIAEPVEAMIRDIQFPSEVPYNQPRKGLMIASWNLETPVDKSIKNIAPVILNYFEVEPPQYMKTGSPVTSVTANPGLSNTN